MNELPPLHVLAQLGAAVEAGRKKDPRAWRNRQRPDKRWSSTRTRKDDIHRRPDVLPFITKIISEHKKVKLRGGYRRVQAVVKMLGITQTMHVDVPPDFKI